MTNLTTLQEALKQYSEFQTFNTGKDTYAQYLSTKNAINKILQDACLDPATLAIMKAQASSNTANQSANQALPTYNVRTPFITLSINNQAIFPLDGATGEDRIHFEEFSVSSPLAAAEMTVNGTLRLFAKDPSSIITAISDTEYNKDAIDGQPILTAQWGWKLATPSGQGGVKTVTTPIVAFLITNIQMTNPEVGGLEFTFTLQDKGNTYLQYTCPNLAIESDYPQQQIRTLIEGCCGMRLFTLDDLLNLQNIRTTGTAAIVGESNDTENGDNLTFFVNDKLGTLRTHSDNFLLIAERLATQCKCKWYATPNNKLSDSNAKSSSSYNSLLKAQQEFKILQAQNTTDEVIAKAAKELDQYFSDLSFGCKLYWVDNVPKEWITTSGTTYIKQFDKAGAFFLLPDLSDTQVDSLGYMDLNYGPGASNFPYLHGSAQNVFNTSIASSTIPSQTFGDVLGVNVQYAPLLTLLKQSVTETAMYCSDSSYMTDGKGGMQKAVITSPTTTPQQIEEMRIKGEATAATGLAAQQAFQTNFKNTPSQQVTMSLLNGLAKKNHLEVVDAPEVLSNNKQYYNTTTGDVYTAMKLRSRVNQFLKLPVRATIKVLGDPTLMRLNQGGFELISYYPSSDGKYQNLNTLLSGVYFAFQITHTITGSDYTTTISGLKQFDKTGIGALVTKVIAQTANEAATAPGNNKTAVISSNLSGTAVKVDLSNSDGKNTFITGFLAKSLQDLYQQQQQSTASTNVALSGGSNPTQTQ